MSRFDGGWCTPEQFEAAHDDRLQGTDLARMQTGMDGFYNLIVAYRKSARILPVTINHVNIKDRRTHEVDFSLEAPDGSEQFTIGTKVKDGQINRWNSMLSPIRKLGRLPSAAFFADTHWNGPESSTISGYDEESFYELAEQREEEALQRVMIYAPYVGIYTQTFGNF